MRDITHTVLARKATAKIQKRFSNTKRFITSLALGTAIIVIGVGTAVAFNSGDKPSGTGNNSITWTGQGASNGVLNTSECDAENDPGGANQPYLLWVFTTDGGSATITGTQGLTLGGTGSGSYSPDTNTGSTFKFVTPYYTPDSNLTAIATFTVTSTGNGAWNLVISHGCAGGTSVTTTALHDADHNVVTVGGSVPLGTTMHDSATVTLTPSAVPTGSVSFRFYNNGNCSGEGVAAGTVALDGSNPGVAHPSTSEGPLAAGDYSFKATWAGQSGYTGSTSSCENFTVNKAQLSVTTNVHNAAHSDITNSSVALGSITHDTATITGTVAGFSIPTPTFTLTSSYTGTCTNGTAVANNGMENTAYKSADSVALAAGNYAYRASIAGNDNYIGSDSTCEPFTVNQAQLGITTDIHNAGHQIVTTVGQGSVVHDTATVTGGVSGFTVPAVTFTFYTNNTCTGTGSTVTTTGTDQGNSAAVRSADSAALTPGFYSYSATVASDSNYIGATATCEPLTVSAYWCSPGFWATAISQNRTGVLNYLSLHGVNLSTKYSVAKAVVNGAPLSKKAPAGDPTISQVLLSPSTYGGPAFNTVADYIAKILGWNGTQFTGENCPLNAQGIFTPTLTLAF